MEQIQIHKSMDSQPIWLKSVRSEADWLDLTNPWLKEGIKSDPELIYSGLYGEFHPPSLLNTFWLIWMSFGGCFSQQVEVSVRSAPDWQLHSVRLRSGSARHRSGIDGLSISIFGLSPWDLHPPWAGSPVFCIYPGTASSSKLVRAGLKGLPL